MAVNMSFFMGLFFMISAYFVPSSLERKGAARFMKDRLVKLGVPILIFMIVVFPVMGYLLYGQPNITLGHLWFLELLLIFSAVYVAYWLVKKPSSKAKQSLPGYYGHRGLRRGHGAHIFRRRDLVARKLLGATRSVRAFPPHPVRYALCRRYHSIPRRMD